jgi:hypothetical protein
MRQALERGEGLHRDTASEEITDEFRLALLLTAFRRFAVSRAAVPPEVWKVFDFPRRSFVLASGCAHHWPWAETLPDRRASRRDEFPH